jgi:carbonic anhydrase
MKTKFSLLLAMIVLVGFIASSIPAKEPVAAHPAPSVTAAAALKQLKEGNARFVEGNVKHPNQSSVSRTELAKGQRPFAIILGCADSRTSPEIVFDQGLGDLFVLRVAGNVLNNETLGSIEFAVEELGSPLIVVLAHERCGAVKAARDTIAAHGTAPGHIQSLVKALEPAVATTAAADADVTAKANALHVAKTLSNSEPFLKEKVATGKLTVVGAHYDLDTGKVEFLEEAAK